MLTKIEYQWQVTIMYDLACNVEDFRDALLVTWMSTVPLVPILGRRPTFVSSENWTILKDG